MAIGLLVVLAITIALTIVSYILMPKPKQPRPEAARDGEAATADAGIEIPWLFGTKLIKAPNVLDATDKTLTTYKVKA